MDLNVGSTPAMATWNGVIGLVSLLSVVLDSDRRSLGPLVDHERKDGLLHCEVLARRIQPDLKGGSEPQLGILSHRKPGGDRDQSDARRRRPFRVDPRQLRWPFEGGDNEPDAGRDRPGHDLREDRGEILSSLF